MSNEKNNAADNKKLVIGPMVFAGFLIFIGVFFLVTWRKALPHLPWMFLLLIMSIGMGLFLAIPYSIILLKDPKFAKFVFFMVAGGFLIVIGVFLLVTYSTISSYPTMFLLAIMSIGMGLFLTIPYSIILLKYPKYATFVFLMVAGEFIIAIGVSSLFTAQGYYYGLQQAISITMSIYSIVGGFILLIVSSIQFAVKSQRQKKLDSMSQSDLANMFDCPSNGKKGAVYLIKLVKDQILVKQSCPTLVPYGWTNKVRLLKIPLRLKDQCISHFRDTVFRCYKCGQEATVDHVKFSGPWTLIKLSCPTHGNKLPTHKIWSTVYSDISNGVDNTP